MKRIILFFMTISVLIFPDIIGHGIGETEVLAKKSALDELSQQIEVKVDSLFYTEESANGDQYTRNSAGVVNLLSNNFLIGVDYEIEKIGKNYSATAIISKDKLYFYEQKISDSYSLVNNYYNKSKSTKSIGEKKSLLLASIKELKKGDSYNNIALLLGSKTSITSPVNEFKLKEELQNLKDANLDKIVMYVDLENDKFANIKGIVTKNLTQISKENQFDIIMGDKEYNNTLFQVKVISYTTEVVPPFYYNKKKLSDTIYKSNLTLSFILKDSYSGTIYDTFTFENSSKSFLSHEDALNLSAGRILRDAKESLTMGLSNIF